MTLPFSEVLMFNASEMAPPTRGPIWRMPIQMPTYLVSVSFEFLTSITILQLQLTFLSSPPLDIQPQ